MARGRDPSACRRLPKISDSLDRARGRGSPALPTHPVRRARRTAVPGWEAVHSYMDNMAGGGGCQGVTHASEQSSGQGFSAYSLTAHERQCGRKAPGREAGAAVPRPEFLGELRGRRPRIKRTPRGALGAQPGWPRGRPGLEIFWIVRGTSFRLDTQPAQTERETVFKGEAAKRAAKSPLGPRAPVERIRESEARLQRNQQGSGRRDRPPPIPEPRLRRVSE